MMPKYAQENPCPKCGECGAEVEYYSEHKYAGWETYDRYGYMKRHCRLCGYWWKEEPLDKGQP